VSAHSCIDQAKAIKADGTAYLASRRYYGGSYKSVWRLDWSGSSFSIGASYYTGSYTYAINLDADGNVIVVGSPSGGANIWKLGPDLNLIDSALPYDYYAFTVLANITVQTAEPFTPPVDVNYKKRVAAISGGKFYYEE